MQAITTQYRGPTVSTGARIIARCDARTMTVSWDHGLGVEENHIAAARQLATALGWNGKWVGGGYGDGYVFALDVGEWFTVTGAVL